jgi:plastocyanin
MIEKGGSGFMFATTPVKAGATVTVRNKTAVQHTVSADTTSAGFDVTVDPGKTVTFTAPAKAGAYKFHCNIHTYMTGTLTVT